MILLYLYTIIGSKSDDYHNEMDIIKYSKWLQTSLIPNLPPNSVIVLDNALYNNEQQDKEPTICSQKDEMMIWLQKNKIHFSEEFNKQELYELIKVHKKAFIVITTNELIKNAGHEILLLPPYHPELNPIRLLFTTVKERVTSRNTTLKLYDVEQLALEEFGQITVNEWKPCSKLVIELEQKYSEVSLAVSLTNPNISLQVPAIIDSTSANYSCTDNFYNSFYLQ